MWIEALHAKKDSVMITAPSPCARAMLFFIFSSLTDRRSESSTERQAPLASYWPTFFIQ